jgi:pectate lyase
MQTRIINEGMTIKQGTNCLIKNLTFKNYVAS